MDVVIGIAMTSRDARLLLVEGTSGEGAVIDYDSLDADTRVSVEHIGFHEYVVNAVLDTYADAPANGYTVTRVALTWTDAADADAKLVVDGLEKQGIATVAVVSTTDALEAAAGYGAQAAGDDSIALCEVKPDDSAVGAESLVEEVNSVMPRNVVPGDDRALLVARGALLASADIRDEAAPAVKPAPLTHTLAMVVATAVLIVAGSVFLAMTVRGGHGSAPPQASTPAEQAAPAPPTESVHTVVRKVVPLAGRAAEKSLVAPDTDSVAPSSPRVIRR